MNNCQSKLNKEVSYLYVKGKCAIITGASRGIGKAIALKLASLGVNIVLNYRSSEKEALEVENEIKNMGVEVISVKGDISKSEEVENLIVRS